MGRGDRMTCIHACMFFWNHATIATVTYNARHDKGSANPATSRSLHAAVTDIAIATPY